MNWHIVNCSPKPDTNRKVLGIIHHNPAMKGSLQDEYEMIITCYDNGWQYGRQVRQWCEIPEIEDITAFHPVLEAIFPRIQTKKDNQCSSS